MALIELISLSAIFIYLIGGELPVAFDAIVDIAKNEEGLTPLDALQIGLIWPLYWRMRLKRRHQ